MRHRDIRGRLGRRGTRFEPFSNAREQLLETRSTKNCSSDTPILLSGAGSAWYDVVAEVFQRRFDVMRLRSSFARAVISLTMLAHIARPKQNPRAQPDRAQDEIGLLPALQVWAYVQSIPKRNNAIVGMGKRDAAFDRIARSRPAFSTQETMLPTWHRHIGP